MRTTGALGFWPLVMLLAAACPSAPQRPVIGTQLVAAGGSSHLSFSHATDEASVGDAVVYLRRRELLSVPAACGQPRSLLHLSAEDALSPIAWGPDGRFYTRGIPPAGGASHAFRIDPVAGTAD